MTFAIFPGGRRGGRVAGAQRVPGELGEQLGGQVGGPGAALDDQRDGLVGEALLADGVAAAHPAKHRPAVDLRGLQPLAERADSAAVCLTRVGDRDLRSRLLLVGLRFADRELQSARSVELEILDVQGDSSERRSAAAKPSSSTRSLSPASVPVSIGASTSSSGVPLRSWSVPSWRRIPDITAATAPELHGLGWSCARCAAAIAAARRATVTGRKPRSASAARNAATVAGGAEIAVALRCAHKVAKTSQSLSYARLVAGASAEAAYASCQARLSAMISMNLGTSSGLVR